MKELAERLFWGISAVVIILGTWFLVVAIWPDVHWVGLFPSLLLGLIIWACLYTFVEKKRKNKP